MNSASQAQLVSSHQKDAYYRSYLKSLFADFANNLPGMKTWLRWSKEIDLVADLMYYGLTTLAGYQTLGEEYMNILQISLEKKNIPSKYKRALIVTLEILVPYLLDKLVSVTSHKLRKDGTLLGLQKRTLADVIELTKNVANFLHKYHLVLFYTSGMFYILTKRIFGISYIQVRPQRRNEFSKSYHFLGVMMVIHLSITCLHRFYKVWSSLHRKGQFDSNFWKFLRNFLLFSEEYESGCHPSNGTVPSPENDTGNSHATISQDCCLCQNKITDITSTLCGHVFCWKCIMGWCQVRQECPICKETVIISKLVRLQNHI